LDFQHNRQMAEDGIAGTLVAQELRLVDMATQKHGREAVRERQWLESLPPSIAGQHVYIDPECRSDVETAATWVAGSEAANNIQILGGRSSLSRSIDTTPPPRLRSQKANRMDVDLVIGFFLPDDGDEGIYYFSSEHSRSEAGAEIASRLAERLDLRPYGRSMPILKETRAPAVVVAVRSLSRKVGRVVAHTVAAMYERPHGEEDRG
ncbi:MAG: hypothetical protein KDB69_05050, partial [Acidimicrobiia bacterium]|nr:hypothetical protein [Acidimicrobiia bacterium]